MIGPPISISLPAATTLAAPSAAPTPISTAPSAVNTAAQRTVVSSPRVGSSLISTTPPRIDFINDLIFMLHTPINRVIHTHTTICISRDRLLYPKGRIPSNIHNLLDQ